MKFINKKFNCIFALLFLLFLISARLAADSGAENKKINKDQSTRIDLSGNYLFLSFGAYYLHTTAPYFPKVKNYILSPGFEHATRINAGHEFVLGYNWEWLPGKGTGDANISEYFFAWRYHLQSLSYLPIYSFFFDFSMGVYDYYHNDYAERLRTGAFSLGLGSRFRLSPNWFLQFQIRFRNLQFFISEDISAISGGQDQVLDSLIFRLALGYRYF